jgi:hypothetical protein
MSKKRKSDDPIGDYVEWTEHRYDPGYYTGGRLSPAVRAWQRLLSSREKRVLLIVIIVVAILAIASLVRQWFF